jgi:hypothetical protein
VDWPERRVGAGARYCQVKVRVIYWVDEPVDPCLLFIVATGGLALTLGLALQPSAAAPSGPPIRIGGTLALTGPLSGTAIIHKLTGEIYVEKYSPGG